MILKFIGRGSAFNVKEGNNSAFIKEDNKLFLIDCGEDIFRRIRELDLFKGVNNISVIITHLDSDHVGSLSSLIYYCYYILKFKIDVYFPGRDLRELLLMQGHVGNCYNYHFLNDDFNQLNLVSARPIKVKHIKTLNCFGYLIKCKDKKIWYSGDTSQIFNLSDDIDEFYQDTCLLDYEGNVHASFKKIKKHFKNKEKVFCMHLDSDELIEEIKNNGFNVVELCGGDN